jgi:hypothetical protein
MLIPAASADGAHIGRNISWADTTGLSYGGGIIFHVERITASETTSPPCDNGFSNPLCDITHAELRVFNVLAPCTSDLATPCLAGVWVEDASGKWVAGEYLGEQPILGSRYIFTAQPALELAAARSANFYRFPGVSHDQGDVFQVNPVMDRTINHGVLQDPTSLSTSIRPVVKQADPGDKSTCLTPDFGEGAGFQCWQLAAQTQLQRFKVALRLPKLPQGWVTGRLLNPAISFEDLGNSQKQPAEVTIIGGQLPSPTLQHNYWNDIAESKATWDKLFPVFGLPWTLNYSAGPALGPTNMNQFLDAVKIDPTLDTANSIQTKWDADLSWQTNGSAAGCPTGKFLGYVGSNSLTYASSIPTFDQSEGTLVYKVASPHSLPTGQDFTGVYELLLDENYARCLWSLGTIPITASISVLNADGTTKVATTVIGITGGMIHFEAVGFTFSETDIIAKIARPPAKGPTHPVQTPTKKLIPKKTIKCIRKKPLKIITGSNPKCPTAFKKR